VERWGGDQGGIDDRALPNEYAALLEMGFYCFVDKVICEA
jgi:hypothetical protein